MSAIEPDKLRALEVLVKAAGAKLLEFWPGNSSADPEKLLEQAKGDGSPVTAADLASNEIIVGGLRSMFPDHGILSEEIADRSELLSRSKVWIIDPLDGTRSFINGNDDFSVLVGLVSDGIPIAGLMYFPARGVFARSLKGQGALVGDRRGAVSKYSELRPRSVYFRNFSPTPGPYLYDEWMDSGLAFLSLATGDLDGVIIRMTAHKEWDIAAPISMIRESGGLVTDETGREIAFKTQEMQFRYVVASNGQVHKSLLNLIPAA